MRIRRDGGERGGEERGRKRRRRKELVVVAGQMLRGERDVTCDLRKTTPTCEGVFRETSVSCEKK